jgi:ornithine cyclodeaminase
MLLLNNAELRRALPMSEAIDAMREAFGDDRDTPPRTKLAGSLFMPGRVGAHTGIKVVSVVPGSPAGIVVVFGPDGAALGAVDGPTLTAIRTAAGAGLATRFLARPDARVMAMLGAGSMAADQIAAVREVRKIERVLVWSRQFENAARLAAAVGATPVADANEAVATADIVSCATPSRVALFSNEMVRAGTHINAVGAFTPSMVEVPAETIRRAYIVVDDITAAATEAGDLIQADRPAVATLGDLLAGRNPPIGEDVTVFKSVGIASQDVAAAVRALQQARRLGLGLDVSLAAAPTR